MLATQQEFKFSYQIYEAMVEAWIRRESIIENKNDLREFSNRLAVDLYVNRDVRGAERMPYDELAKIANRWKIPLEQWKLSSRSLLNRDSNGNYKFAHRSIMEYLFVRQLLDGNDDCHGIFLTDQMIMFLKEFTGIQDLGKGNHRFASINKSILINELLHSESDISSSNSRLKKFALRVAVGLMWSKTTAALCMQINKEMEPMLLSGTNFQLSDWSNVEDRIVSGIPKDKRKEHGDDVTLKVCSKLSETSKKYSLTNISETSELNPFIAKYWIDSFIRQIKNYHEVEGKIQDILMGNALISEVEVGDKWADFYRLSLLSFLSSYGLDVLKNVLTIHHDVMIVPLFNEFGNEDGLVVII